MTVGSLVGILVFHTASPAISIALAGSTGLIFVRPRLDERQAARLLWWLGTIGVLYILLNALALTGHADFLTHTPPGNYRHEKSWIIALAFAALLYQRRWLSAALCTGLAGYIYTQYPAATYPVVLIVAIATAYALPRRVEPPRRKLPARMLLVALLIVGATGYVFTHGVVDIASGYFP